MQRGMQSLPYFAAPKLSNDTEIRKVCESLRYEVDNRHFGRDAMIRSLVIPGLCTVAEGQMK
jgi:hypothetical protein